MERVLKSMQIKIHQRKSDKNNTELYKKAVLFFADQLLSKTKLKKLKLSIILKKFKGNASEESGNCEQITRNNYKIEVNNNKPFQGIISTLAHEMIHVKQGMYGQLIMKSNGFVWKNKLYKSVDIDKDNQYDNCSWEKEAYTLEPILTKRFLSEVLVNEVKVFPLSQ